MDNNNEFFEQLRARHTDERGVLDVDSLIGELNTMLHLAIPLPKQNLYNISRGGNYSIESSVCEFADNALTPEIGCTFVSVSFSQVGRKLTQIIFADDGVSMDVKHVVIFWTLANASHFLDPESLSKFGFGAKTGGYFLGNIITLYTKQNGAIMKTKQTYDTFPTINWCETEEDCITQQEIDMVNEKLCGSEHGTVIVIDEVNFVGDDSKTKISNRIKKAFEKVYCENPFVKDGSKRLIVDGEEIKPLSIYGINKSTIFNGVDLMVKNRIHANREIKVSGCKTPIIYVPMHKSRYEGSIDLTDLYDIKDFGLYVVRNGRLLTIDPITDYDFCGAKNGSIKHKQYCGVIYITGEHDDVFKVPYNKELTSLRSLREDVKEVLIKYVKKDINESQRRYKAEAIGNVSEEVKDVFDGANEFLDNWLSPFKKTKTYRETPHENPTDESVDEPVDEPVDDNTNDNDDDAKDKKPRNRKKKLSSIGFMNPVNEGERGDFIYPEIGKNICNWVVNVNIDHPDFKKFGFEINSKALASLGYFVLCQHLSIMVRYEESLDEKYINIYDYLTRADEIREDFVRDMNDKKLLLGTNDNVTHYNIKKLKECIGKGVKFEDIKAKELEAAESAAE